MVISLSLYYNCFGVFSPVKDVRQKPLSVPSTTNI